MRQNTLLFSVSAAALIFGMTALNASDSKILDLTSKISGVASSAGKAALDAPVKSFNHIHEKVSTNTFKSWDAAENEAIIVFKTGTKLSSKFYDILQKFSFEQFKLANAMWVKSSSMSTEQLIKFFSAPEFSGFIAKVTPNFKYRPFAASNDTDYSKLWAVENNGQDVNGKKGTKDADMDISEAWNREKGSHDVIVAVLDTGVDYTHEDLTDNMYDGLPKHGYDFAGDDDGNNDDDPMPDTPYDKNGHYHGTHVAGIIGAVGNNNQGVSGVNQNVEIMALKVFRPNGYGYTNDILEALDYVADRIDKGDNIVTINASYGGSGGSQDDATNRAIKKLGEKGVVFCAAAGNDGKNIDSDPVYPASYNANNIIAVAATDQDDKLASFSNYGKKSVDVAAPGTNILSTYPENKYAYLQGTSMATPYVTGSVALLAAHDPESSVSERIALIENNVDKKDNLQGKIASDGRVNINSTLVADDEGSNGGGDEEQNHAPVAKDDAAKTKQEQSVTIDVLANDSDPDGDTISIKSVNQPAHGTVSIKNNKVEYTPDSGFSGTDKFSYKVTDGEAESSANVAVEVEKKKDNNNGGGMFGGLFGGGNNRGNSGWFW